MDTDNGRSGVREEMEFVREIIESQAEAFLEKMKKEGEALIDFPDEAKEVYEYLEDNLPLLEGTPYYDHVKNCMDVMEWNLRIEHDFNFNITVPSVAQLYLTHGEEQRTIAELRSLASEYSSIINKAIADAFADWVKKRHLLPKSEN